MYENQMYNNYYGYAYGAGAPQYAPKFRQAQMTQPLTNEEKAILKSKGGEFNTKVTQEDLLKSFCTHKENGMIVATQNQDGSYTCPICHETFNAASLDKADLEADVEKVIDDLQNVKLTYLDIPAEVARQYFTLIPLLKKLPQLGVIASNNWASYENANPGMMGGNSPYGFAQLNQMTYGGAMPMGYGMGMPMGQPMMYGQPAYQQPMQQPVYPQQPVMDPNAMANPMNPNGAYPVYANGMMPQQAGMMMNVQPATMPTGNEFGTFGNPAYVAQPQVAAPAQPAVQQPAQNAAPAPAAAPVPQPNQPVVENSAFQI